MTQIQVSLQSPGIQTRAVDGTWLSLNFWLDKPNFCFLYLKATDFFFAGRSSNLKLRIPLLWIAAVVSAGGRAIPLLLQWGARGLRRLLLKKYGFMRRQANKTCWFRFYYRTAEPHERCNRSLLCAVI